MCFFATKYILGKLSSLKEQQVLKYSNNVDFPKVSGPMHTNTLIHYTNFSIFAYCAVAAQQWFCCYTCIPLCLLLYKSFQKRTFWRTPPDNITSYILWSSSESKKCPILSVAKSRDISYILSKFLIFFGYETPISFLVHQA